MVELFVCMKRIIFHILNKVAYLQLSYLGLMTKKQESFTDLLSEGKLNDHVTIDCYIWKLTDLQ